MILLTQRWPLKDQTGHCLTGQTGHWSYGRYFISNTHTNLCTHSYTPSFTFSPSISLFFFFCLSPLVKSIKMAAITSNLVPHDLFTRTADQVLIVGWLSKASVTERGPRDSSPR